jgi:Protein of unknown function (DUF2630)
MDDTEILARINELVNEENLLWEHESHGTPSEDDRKRLEEIKVQLDRAWDLLRQRRAREEFGLDPNSAQTRSEGVVEHYQQ